MVSARFNRRTLLQGTAAGAAALTTAGKFAAPARVGAADAVELEFWTPADDPVGSKIIQDIADAFNSSVGKDKGIKVNTRIKPTTGNNYVQYTTAMTSSGSPDVVMTYVYNPVIAWAANGFIQPMDDYAAQAGIKQADFFPVAWQMINFGDHIWGLMQEFDFNQFWWNKDIHAGDPPTTIDELDALAAEYTKFDGSGNLTQAGFIPWLKWNGALSGYNDWDALWGGRWYDPDNRKWTINTPENLKYFEWLVKYADALGGREKSDAFEAAASQVYGDIFEAGLVAFAIEGEYIPPALKAQGLNLNYGISQLPVAEGVPTGTAYTGGGNLFLLPTNAKHPQEAVTFIQYMGTGKPVMDWCVPNSNIPPTTAAAADPAFTSALPEMKPWLDTLAQNHMVPPSQSPQLDLFSSQEIYIAMDAVTYKQKSPQDALTDLEAKIADAVKNFQAAHPEWQGE
ncbi:MAG TPA: extracellular solute-binding protein [Thermomicrobiales bacterium]|jgi:ABC-type glycerol-3-phosphate transport system substrate-binding protein